LAQNQVTVRVDEKGRVTLPKKIRAALGVEYGDAISLKLEPESHFVRLARTQNPFDALAQHAIKEFKEGRTRTIEEFKLYAK
jgi:AbrB family looped-hinge helix DNA binding protein